MKEPIRVELCGWCSMTCPSADDPSVRNVFGAWWTSEPTKQWDLLVCGKCGNVRTKRPHVVEPAAVPPVADARTSPGERAADSTAWASWQCKECKALNSTVTCCGCGKPFADSDYRLADRISDPKCTCLGWRAPNQHNVKCPMYKEAYEKACGRCGCYAGHSEWCPEHVSAEWRRSG
jgi:hypothetical protein